jgi:hypothetical protein
VSLKAMLEQAAAASKVAQETGKPILRPVVGPQHARWITLPEKEQAFTPAALKRGMEVLSDGHKVKRDERFSASGLGDCPRRQIFSYMGEAQLPPSPASADIMRSGTAAHFWIMMEGLSAGWLIEAEVFYRDEHYRVGGTLDGIISDASIWEYKSVSQNIFRDVQLSDEQAFAKGEKALGPKHHHLLQLEAYELLTGMNLKSLFYQHRDYGGYYEYRLDSDAKIKGQLITLLEKLNGHIDDNTLPPMYDDCERGVGNVFKDCPYSHICRLRETPHG